MVTHTPHAGQWVREPHSDCPGGLREALSEPADAAQCRPDVPPERWGFSGAGLLARALLGRGGGLPGGRRRHFAGGVRGGPDGRTGALCSSALVSSVPAARRCRGRGWILSKWDDFEAAASGLDEVESP